MSPEARFFDFMCGNGLRPARDFRPVADSRIHRFDIEGERRGSMNGWIIMHPGNPAHGVVGSWRLGEKHIWRDRLDGPVPISNVTAAIRRNLATTQNVDAAHLKAEQARAWAEAKAEAARIWTVAEKPRPAHPYLAKKGVCAWGIRQWLDRLVVPLRDADGQLDSLQFIGPDGTKRFLRGGRVQGRYHAIGEPAGTLCICEGYATAASVYQATGNATAVAFNAGNLEPVAKVLRAKFPGLRIVICADDDYQTPGNPGMAAATRAAAAVDGWLAKPDFSAHGVTR